MAYAREEVEARVDRVEALSFLVRKPIESMPQAALRWVLDNPCVSLVLTGAKSAAEVRDGARGRHSGRPTVKKKWIERLASCQRFCCGLGRIVYERSNDWSGRDGRVCPDA